MKTTDERNGIPNHPEHKESTKVTDERPASAELYERRCLWNEHESPAKLELDLLAARFTTLFPA